MPSVEISFTALPAHVRTARLVALAVARRAGVAEDALEEVRLAVSEACSRAVGVHVKRAPDTPVSMVLSDDQDRFAVEVTDVGQIDEDVPEASDIDPDALSAPADPSDGAAEVLPAGFGLAVISGLVEDLDVTSDGNGTVVRMTWPAADVMAP